MIFYFAYGSNMHPRTMRERCPGARPHSLARLDGWRFFINRRGAASIWPDPNGVVYGVLWACQLGHFAGLDAFEGVRWHHYFRRRLFVALPHAHVGAFVYTGTRHMTGRARPNYMLGAVLPGARAFGLPGGYITELESWLPRRALGAQGHANRYVGRRRPARFPQ